MMHTQTKRSLVHDSTALLIMTEICKNPSSHYATVTGHQSCMGSVRAEHSSKRHATIKVNSGKDFGQ